MSESSGIEQDQKPQTANSEWNKLFTITGLPQLLQLAAVLSSLSYIFGYIIWGKYARDFGLGYLPAIRDQYFIAGIPPLIIFFITYLFLRGHYKFSNHFKMWLDKQKSKTVIILNGICLVIMVLIVILDGSTLYFKTRLPIWVDILTFIISYLPMLLIYLTSTSSLGVGFVKFYFPLFIAYYMSFLYTVYSSEIFPYLPHELGGPEPMRVALDVKRDYLSNSTIKLLTVIKGDLDSNKVVRTSELFLIFEEGDFLIFKQKLKPLGKENALVKIKREAISVIFNLDTVSTKR